MTKTVKLYDVATISTGNSAPQDEKLFKDGVHNFVRTSDVGQIRKGIIFEARDKLNDKGILKLKKFPKGTILFPKSGASTFLNHRVMLGMDAYVSSHLATIKGDNTKVLDSYLLYILETIDAANLVADSSYPSLKTQTISEIELVLPSILEQQHIVSKLDAAFTEIDKTNLINMRIHKNLNEISDKFINLKFDSIVEKKTLGSLCDFLNGYAFKSKETVDTSNVQLLRMGNLYNNKLDLGRRSVFYPESYANDYNKYIINPGDIVMTLTGTVGKRDYGYAIEISETKLKLLLNQRILKLHNFKSNSINKKYLLFYLNSKSFLNVLFKTANGTRQANLSSDTIKKLKIPVPSIDNQIKILKKLKLLDENKKILLENLKTKSKLLNSLKFSLINNLIKDKAA